MRKLANFIVFSLSLFCLGAMTVVQAKKDRASRKYARKIENVIRFVAERKDRDIPLHWRIEYKLKGEKEKTKITLEGGETRTIEFSKPIVWLDVRKYDRGRDGNLIKRLSKRIFKKTYGFNHKDHNMNLYLGRIYLYSPENSNLIRAKYYKYENERRYHLE